MSDREAVYVEALSVMSMGSPNWWYKVSLGDRVIHSDGWYDDCETALAAGREWAEAKGYDVIPIRADEESDSDDLGPYCHECGNDDRKRLACIDNYANGTRWRCEVCGHEFHTGPKPIEE